MKVTFKANWCKAWQKGVRKGSLLLKPFGANEKNLAEFLNKLQHWQDDKEQLRELDITLEVHYKKRTLDMNNLMWGLYDVIANELNNGKSWRELEPHEREGYLTPDKLYDEDLRDHAEIFSIIIDKDSVKWVKDEYRIFNEEPYSDEKVKLYGFLSTSKMNTVQMADWIDRLFRRLSHMGVHLDKGSDVKKYWEEYQGHRSLESYGNRIFTGKEYKEHRPYCEATGAYLGEGGGSIAHIVARGMGRNPMEGKYKEVDIMHLSDVAHALFDNGKGREHFIKKYPHLRMKIENALQVEIGNSQGVLIPDEIDEKTDRIVHKEITDMRNDIPLM